MQMPYVTIVGAAGYTGQETLDRVLHHPELELYAVERLLAGVPGGSDDGDVGHLHSMHKE